MFQFLEANPKILTFYHDTSLHHPRPRKLSLTAEERCDDLPGFKEVAAGSDDATQRPGQKSAVGERPSLLGARTLLGSWPYY